MRMDWEEELTPPPPLIPIPDAPREGEVGMDTGAGARAASREDESTDSLHTGPIPGCHEVEERT